MRTAIFGGTFDPIHTAHLVVAREAAETFSLDRVLFIPAANPPLKETGASYEDRYRMVELACAGDARFQPSRLEEGAEKSYSIYTIERVTAMTEKFSSSSGPTHSRKFEAGTGGKRSSRRWNSSSWRGRDICMFLRRARGCTGWRRWRCRCRRRKSGRRWRAVQRRRNCRRRSRITSEPIICTEPSGRRGLDLL
jgi:cytidyltransferase-like protein